MYVFLFLYIWNSCLCPLVQIWDLKSNNKTRILGIINPLFTFHYIPSIWYDMDRIENTASNSSYTVAFLFVAADVFNEPLPSNSRLFWLHGSRFQVLGEYKHTDSKVSL
jgi:hypothetical protein